MDEFDFAPDSGKPSRRSGKAGGRGCSGVLWNLGALYFIVMALALGVYFIMVFMNPTSGLNFFPPKGGVVVQVPTLIPTNTPRPATLEPTATQPEIVFEPSETAPSPVEGTTETAPTLPTATDVVLVTVTPGGGTGGSTPFYVAQQAAPIAYPDGCNGMYVAGNVIDINGAPVVFMVIRMSGALGTEDAFSGTAAQYSESGYEIQISPNPQDTSGQVFLQLIDSDSGEPVSDLLLLDTFADCSKNLTIVNWVQTR